MRKGSLQLSVNAIVVLVLAITMLGLGLAFTKGKFADLGERIEVPEPDYPATEAKPIVLPTNEIKLKSDKAGGFSVNYYNSRASADYVPCLICKGSGYTDTALTLGSQDTQGLYDSVFVKAGEYETFRIIINRPGVNGYPGVGGKVLCTIGFIQSDNPTSCSTSATFDDEAQVVLRIQ